MRPYLLFNRRVFRHAGVAVLTMALVGCGARPGADVLASVTTKATDTKKITIYAATTRARQAPDENVFTTGRARDLNYARFTMSIPPTHKASNIEWPKGKPDPARDFVVADQKVLSGAAFDRDITLQSRPHKTIGVFVHGYNYSFQEALFRLAQMTTDSDSAIDAVPILFAWPSQGTLTGYVADREAVLYSRDYLQALLLSLAKDKSADEILLFGHSMGSFLIMETLRQLKMEGREDVLSRLRVILAAPDIDADVFRTQLEVIGKLDPPLTILVSNDDRALYASSLLDADNQRVGRLDINDPKIREAAAAHGVQVVDISSLKTTDTFRHDRYASLAKFYPELAALDRPKGKTSVGQVGAFVLNAAGATISSPFRLVSQAISPQ
jgi:esterase/lipase superfamily enzyme